MVAVHLHTARDFSLNTYESGVRIKSTTSVMKLFALALGFLGVMGAARASEEEAQQYMEAAHEEKQLSKFNLDYVIDEYPISSVADVAQLQVDQKINLQYTLRNDEEFDLSVVGLGGALRDSLNGDYLYNLTSTSLGPLVVKPGQEVNFSQAISLEVSAGYYLLLPQVFVAYDQSLKVVQAKGLLLSVEEAPVSLLNPQFLFLEIIFVALLGGAGYFFFYNQLAPYLKGTSPSKSVPVAKTSGFDPLWVPEHHQATQRKSKTRKAY